MKIMASSPITSWHRDGETIETVTDFFFLGSKITAGGDCSHEIKRHLLLGRKAMTNLDSIIKSRDISLPTKICRVKAMVFPVVLCECENWKESWALKNWCFWTVLEKILESPLDSKEIKPVNPKGNQSWIFIGGIDAEALILWPPDAKSQLIREDWHWERLKAGGEGDDRGWDGWMASLTRWTWVWASSGSWWWTGKPRVLQSMGSQRVGHDWATELTDDCSVAEGRAPCPARRSRGAVSSTHLRQVELGWRLLLLRRSLPQSRL